MIYKSLMSLAPQNFKKIIKKLLIFYRTKILKDNFHIQLKHWVEDNGDETYRLDYPLNSNSIVFDVGGYQGDFANAINKKYQCNVFLFEPIREFYLSCSERFKDNNKIHCFNFGLSSSDGDFQISKENDGSSIVKQNKVGNTKVKIKSFTSFLLEEKIFNIDLLKINIEGGEYDLLPHLIETNAIQQIYYLQIQFHNFIKNSSNKRTKIRADLSETHMEMWNYDFVWESWKRK